MNGSRVRSVDSTLRAAGRLVGSAALATALVLSWQLAGLRLIDTHAAGSFARSLFPPDVSPAFVGVVAVACARTLGIALAGTLLSLVIGLPLGVLATPTLFRRGPLLAGEPPGIIGPALSLLARGVLRVLRAVPDLVWALLFVVAFGLGPLAGALALAVNTAGVIGRVAADLFEAAPPRPLEALHASGASRAQVFALAIWPQTASSLAGYVLYSFECCVRAASVLGFVGAGGIGHEIQLSMRMFEYGQVLTLLAALWVLLVGTEWFSARLRRRWQSAAPLPNLTALRPARLTPWIAVALLAFWLAGFGDALASGPGLLRRMARFAGQLFPPDLSPAFLRTLVEPLAQTLAISVVGTLLGIVLGALLGLPATATLVLPPRDEPGVRLVAPRIALYAAARFTLALLRAIPELVWVLLCIVAVGLGPSSGALALGLHTGGVLGKLYAETLEEVPPRAVDALRASGASRLQALLFAAWPLARETLASYTLLRWETNLRVSTVVGLVGGGGLGRALYNDVQLGFHDRAATVVILIYGLVALTDALADRVRAPEPKSGLGARRLKTA
jgi:phosphonate transport system permease protein